MIYKQFEQSDIVVGRSTKVSTGIFSNGSVYQTQSAVASGSLQATISGSNRYDVYNGYYYLDVYPSLAATSSSNDLILSIAYGNKSGYGTSYDEYTNIKVSPTKAIYTQYVNSLNNGEDFSVKSQSTPASSVTSVTLSSDFIVLSYNSQKIRDGIDAGQFQLTLRNDVSNQYVRLIDDSSITSQSGSAAYYNLILGQYNETTGEAAYCNYSSVANGLLSSGTPDYTGAKSVAQYHPTTGIGLIFPKAGIVVLNCEFLNDLLMTATGTNYGNASSNALITIPSTATPDNVRTNAPVGTTPATSNALFKQAVYNAIRASGDNMRVRRSEYVPSRHYFVRVKNRDFNYTNNPTFSYQRAQEDTVTGEIRQRGDIIQTEFLTDPKVYPTSVGLYNNNNELVAIAKLSRPAQKTFSNEFLIKVRLDF
jgi:hypothetical protein